MSQAKVSLRQLSINTTSEQNKRQKIMAKKKLENLSFEESLSELDTIVQSLERGELSLEDSMALFERGLNLSKVSQVKLQTAEQRVKILLEQSETADLSHFTSETDEA